MRIVNNNITNLPDVFKYIINNKLMFLKKNRLEKGTDLNLLYNIQPLFGVKFEDTYWRLGDSYMTCIHIYSAPEEIGRHWLYDFFKLDNVFTTVDIRSLKINDTREIIKRGIDEIGSHSDTNDILEIDDNDVNEKKLFTLLAESKEGILCIDLRIYVMGRSFFEMENNVERVEDFLNDCGYKEFGRNLNEQKEEYLSLFVSPGVIKKTLSARDGIPVPTNIMASGLPFHYVGWQDPNGFYLGDTENYSDYGSVIFDPFRLTKLRTCYDGFICGVKGSGKSTIIKNLIENIVAMGNGVRIIDVTGEFEGVVRNMGGVIVKFDSEGKIGIVNLLEILRMDENDTDNYHNHVSKLEHIYRFLSPTCTEQEVKMFLSLLKKLYVKFGIINSEDDDKYENITGLEHTKYPIFSDYIALLEEEISEIDKKGSAAKEYTVKILVAIKLTIDNIVKNYGSIFNGHTTINSFESADIVSYDLSDIVNMGIFDVQLFNVLSMAYDSCMTVGTKMKYLYDNKKIKLEDVKHHLIVLDESYISINADKPFAVKRISEIMSICRKFFIGVYLITPRISDICKADNVNNQIKDLFKQCQYKMILRQDSLSIPDLQAAFSHILTPVQIEEIPKLNKQELYLVLSSAQTIRMRMKELPDYKLAYYGGGA